MAVDGIRCPSTNGIKIAVVAGHDIPVGVVTSTQHSSTPLFNLDTVFWREDDVEFIIKVTVDNTGRLICEPDRGLSSDWLKFVRLAKHCQMQNSQIIFDDCQTMRLQVIRPIRKGEPLYSWFSIEAGKIFHIPFLSPKNILDGCRYSCHLCGQVYEDPNPLKVHMTFRCPLHQHRLEVEVPTFKSAKSSAFHRVSPKNETLPFDVTAQNGRLLLPNFTAPPMVPRDVFHHQIHLVKPAEDTRPLKEVVKSEIKPVEDVPETSTDGRQVDNRRRHKCFYCGKLYSRKYGLKIHIRTHTGYKPLKCKLCLRPFGDPSNLNKHVRLHAEGSTPYKCQLCGKMLVRRRDLERHLRSRHPNATNSNEETLKSCK